jgi:pilus assembly protein CpaC
VALMAALMIALGMMLATSAARAIEAGNSIDLSPGAKPTSLKISAGKSEHVHTDASFGEVVVGDPEIADVMPLTDHSLSILGKKIGTTRVTAYSDKKLVGVFDIEVTYDTSYLGNELARRFPTAHFRVTSVNGKILLSGEVPDAVTLDRAVSIAKQFGPDVINSVQVSQPQQVLLEVRFIEVNRNASRELGINWNVVGSGGIVNLGTNALLSLRRSATSSLICSTAAPASI